MSFKYWMQRKGKKVRFERVLISEKLGKARLVFSSLFCRFKEKIGMFATLKNTTIILIINI